MADLQGALDTVVYDRLVAQLVPSVPGVTIAQTPSQDAPPPLAVIGEVTAENIGAKGDALTRFTMTVITETNGAQRKPLNALQGRVFDALDGWRAGATGGVQFGEMTWASTSSAQAEDGRRWFGAQIFTVIAQPA